MGTWVVAVKATDSDIGKNGEIHYELMENSANPTEDRTKFHINSRDGNITTAAKINREMEETFFVSFCYGLYS